MLVTRRFINDVGLMAEDYFLYMEDLDWGLRRGGHKIGFARGAVVRHIGGTSIGSAPDRKARSPLSVYLSSRNSVLFTRRWAGRRWTIHLAVQLLYVARYLLYGSLVSTKAALAGVIDGVRGKTGRPDMSVYHPLQRGTDKCGD
jgi:GT2 family glycosyltransferase